MGYDCGDSFHFDFEPNGVPFGSKSKGKQSLRPYPIQCERKRKYSFLSVHYSKLPQLISQRNPISVIYLGMIFIYNNVYLIVFIYLINLSHGI